jgi:hypothetical protein
MSLRVAVFFAVLGAMLGFGKTRDMGFNCIVFFLLRSTKAANRYRSAAFVVLAGENPPGCFCGIRLEKH